MCDCRSVLFCCVDVFSNKLQGCIPVFQTTGLGQLHQGSRCGARVPWSQALPETNDMATEVALLFGGGRFLKMLKLVHLGGGNPNIFGIFTPKIWGNDPIRLDNIFQMGVKPTN